MPSRAQCVQPPAFSGPEPAVDDHQMQVGGQWACEPCFCNEVTVRTARLRSPPNMHSRVDRQRRDARDVVQECPSLQQEIGAQPLGDCEHHQPVRRGREQLFLELLLSQGQPPDVATWAEAAYGQMQASRYSGSRAHRRTRVGASQRRRATPYARMPHGGTPGGIMRPARDRREWLTRVVDTRDGGAQATAVPACCAPKPVCHAQDSQSREGNLMWVRSPRWA